MSNHFQSASSLPLNRDSDEWGPIESFLQVVFRTANISLRSLWSVSNPGVLAKFERRSRNLTAIVPTLVAAEDIGQNMTLATVCDKGFPDSQNGLRVQVGNLTLPSGFLNAGLDGSRVQGRGRRMFEYLVVKVAVGKSYVMEAPDFGAEDDLIQELGAEYDSVLIRPGPVDHAIHPLRVTSSSPAKVSNGFLPPHAFCQSYVLREGAQILPMYVCRFEVDTDKDEPLALEPCQNCEENPATIWCAADAAGLCPACDTAHHAVNVLTQKHIRVPINERPRQPGPCGIRQDKPAELWSESMGFAVCKETQKEHYPTTVFEDLRDAYKSSVRVARRQDEDFERVKETLIARIVAQDEAIASLERMFHDCEETSYRKISDGLQRALTLTEKKTHALIASEKELQTRIQFLQWADHLLTPFSHMLPPADWLELWLEHYRLVREYILTDTQNPPETSEADPTAEIKLSGYIQVRDTLIRNI